MLAHDSMPASAGFTGRILCPVGPQGMASKAICNVRNNGMLTDTAFRAGEVPINP